MQKYLLLIFSFLFSGCDLSDTCTKYGSLSYGDEIIFYLDGYNTNANETSILSSKGYDYSFSNGALICKEYIEDAYWRSTIPAIRMFYKEDSLYKTFATNTEEFYNNYSVYLEDSNGTLSSYNPASIDQFKIWVYEGEATYSDGCGGEYTTSTFSSSFDNNTEIHTSASVIIGLNSDNNTTFSLYVPLEL